jgi:copper transport protein
VIRCFGRAAVQAAPAVGLILLLLAWPATVRAHAIVLESSPAHDATLARAPDRVVLRFNVQIEKRLTRATLAGGAGAALPVSIATHGAQAEAPDRLVIPLPPLGPGTYVLRYRVLAGDGHITEGALRFTVGASQ